MNYLIDELENAIDYLEQAAYYYQNKSYKHRFKWLMISLHGALYSFGVCAVKGTSPKRVIKRQKKKEKIIKDAGLYSDLADEIREPSISYFASKLDDVWTVINKCKDPDYMNQFVNSRVLEVNEIQKVAIDKLIDYRNEFAHFKPAGRVIIGDLDKDIVKPVVDVIEYLALESNNVRYLMISDERVRKAIAVFKR